MTEGRSPRTADMLMQMGGRMGGQQQGGQQQAIQLVMGASDALMQAAQLDPNIAPIVQQAMQTLQQGLTSLGGPEAGGPPQTGGRKQRRPRRPKEEEGEEESPEMGAGL